jgi:hypothetical protein
MSCQFDDLEKRALALRPSEKAALIRALIEDLDPSKDRDVERLFLEEAERRYEQFLRGEVEAIPGEEVMAQARQRLE